MRGSHATRDLRCTCGKVGWAGRKRAATAAALVTRRSGEPFVAYRCQQGHCWHIGHPPGWKTGTC